MEFQLSDEQKMITKMVRDFAEKEIAPTVHQRDEEEVFDRSIVDKLGELGLMGIFFPEEYGGGGGDYMSYILANEELARVDDSIACSYAASVSLCAWPIYTYGTEEQKQKYLVPLAEGTKLGAFGLTEPNAGTDSAQQQSHAEKVGDHYVLNGSKIFITNGGAADIYVVFAMTDKSQGTKAFPPLSWKRVCRALPLAKRNINWAFTAPRRWNWYSRTSLYRRKTFSAKKERL